MSLEQIVRGVLSQAIKDGLVAPSAEYGDPDPQCRSAGELGATVNVLAEFLAGGVPMIDQERGELLKDLSCLEETVSMLDNLSSKNRAQAHAARSELSRVANEIRERLDADHA